MDRRNFIQNTVLAGIATGLKPSLTTFGAKLSPAIPGKRIGMIGLDTSHSVDFVKAMNGSDAGEKYDGYTIIIAYPNGSKDIESSFSRIPGYTVEVKKYGVRIAASLEEVIRNSDVILLETNDGKLHLEQALPVMKAGKRLFIDKPIGAHYRDVNALYEASIKYNTPFFTSSSLRYVENIQDIQNGSLAGKVMGADVYSPCALEPSHTDFYWYGIHGVETLFAVMGKGCVSVSRVHTEGTDIAVGVWENGRIGIFRGNRTGINDYGGTVFGEKQNVKIGPYAGFGGLLLHIVAFFKTGVVPVDTEETKEIYAFMTAADESRKSKGEAVLLSSVLHYID